MSIICVVIAKSYKWKKITTVSVFCLRKGIFAPQIAICCNIEYIRFCCELVFAGDFSLGKHFSSVLCRFQSVHCPSYKSVGREFSYSKMTEKRQGLEPRVCLIDLNVCKTRALLRPAEVYENLWFMRTLI